MLKKYELEAEVIGMGKPFAKTSAKGKPYEACYIHFGLRFPWVHGVVPFSTMRFDFKDLVVGAKVDVEVIMEGRKIVFFDII